MRRLMLQLAVVPVLAAGFVMARPAQAHAGECTESYFVCLNGALMDKNEAGRVFGEIECGIDLYVCMAKKIQQ